MFKNDRGFTLIEMLIVLLVITVLIVLIIPNLSGRTEHIYSKGCEALKATVQAQVDAYHLEKKHYPASLNTLVTDEYLSAEQTSCQNDEELVYDSSTGTVTIR